MKSLPVASIANVLLTTSAATWAGPSAWWNRWLVLAHLSCLLGWLLAAPEARAQTTARLSQAAMLADFDTLTAAVQRISPQLAIKKKLWRYEATQPWRELRKSIDTVRSVTSFALLLNRALTACQDYHTSLLDLPDDYWQADKQFKLYLPLAYVEGQYLVAKSFTSGGHLIPVGATVTHVGQQPIQAYVAQLVTDKVLRYDLQRHQFYSESFYQNQRTLFTDTLPLVFKTPAGQRVSARIPCRQRLAFVHPIADTIRNQVVYWPDKQVLYIKLYRMDKALIPLVQKKLGAFRRHPQPLQRIIIDLRDNSGGSDAVWQALYEAILPSPIHYPLQLDGLSSARLPTTYLRQVEVGRDSIRVEAKPLLRAAGLSTFYRGTGTLVPTDSSLRFTGKVIVLGNENNYSSGASAFKLPLADPNDQYFLISRPTGMFLGMGYAPVLLTLPNSGLRYRVEPVVETTGVQTLAGLMHDSPPIQLPYTQEEVYQREAYRGNALGSEYLKTTDPFIRRALAL